MHHNSRFIVFLRAFCTRAMSRYLTESRIPILVLGPIVLVGFSYWISIARPRQVVAASANAERVVPGVAGDDGRTQLHAQCNAAAQTLATRLDSRFVVVARTPYVLAGNMTPEALDKHYTSTIVPTAHALANSYFDQETSEPIVIVLFASESSYREVSQELDNRNDASYYGYYLRPQRRIMLNIATGNGTLAHELTHALAHVDFPTMPEWFDEGLASLHEESEFSDDGLRLTGQSNWRIDHLRSAIQRDRLRPLESLIAGTGIRSGHESTDYAHARYFCLFLQERQLLSHFYRKLRMASTGDTSADDVLRKLFGVVSVAQIDAEFRAWVAALTRRRTQAE